jgi:Conjugal transfer protein TraD
MAANGHSHEQGLRVHHLANLGGLVTLAGLDREPPDFLLGALISVARESATLGEAQRAQVASMGRKQLEERATSKRGSLGAARENFMRSPSALDRSSKSSRLSARTRQRIRRNSAPTCAPCSRSRAMRRRRFFGQKEVDIKLRPAKTERPRPLIPWWAVALRRVRVRWGIRRQSWGSLSGGQTWRRVALDPHAYSRRSVVKASFKRNDHTGGWAAHARYLSRQGAQREHGQGQGFDTEHDAIDMVAVVRDWEKHDELLWRFVVSPEDGSEIPDVGPARRSMQVGWTAKPSMPRDRYRAHRDYGQGNHRVDRLARTQLP